MAVTQFKPEEQNPSAAPTLGMSTGILGQGVIPGQGREVSSRQKGSGRFTNLQSYIRANEPESGGLNPNARLVQQRTEQAGSQLGQRQSEFTGGVERVGTGLQGIQERANVAQSAFQDPTKFVQSPENLKRFTALRTGQENIPGVTETYGQIEPLRLGLASEQRNIASGLRTDVGQNLQNYIRSQRQIPSLATLGEMQLDRFLTEQTPSGQAAIESAVTRAGQIESEQTPAQERLAQLETLRSQLAQNPLVTQAGILNRLETERGTAEQNLRNVNPSFIQEKVGLSGRTADPRYSDLEVAQYRRDTINNYNQRIQETQNQINDISNRINELNKEYNYMNVADNVDMRPGTQSTNDKRKKQIEEEVRNLNNQLNNVMFDNNSLRTGLSYMDLSLQPKLAEYESNLGLNRQQALQKYDPATLARIQAIGQLAGRGFEDILGGRLA